jgi:hypothetical protein
LLQSNLIQQVQTGFDNDFPIYLHVSRIPTLAD